MTHSDIEIRLTNAQALVLFDWLARSDQAQCLVFEHPAEQKILWLLEGLLEKNVQVFSSEYKRLLDDAREKVDSSI